MKEFFYTMLYWNISRGFHVGAEIRGCSKAPPGRRAGRLPHGRQLQRPARLQAGRGRELHLLQVNKRDIMRRGPLTD